MNNRFNINEEEKSRIKSLHNIKVIKEQWVEVDVKEQVDGQGVEGLDEQPSLEDGMAYLDPNQNVDKQVDKMTSQNHKAFMDGVHSMCDKIGAMGNEGKIGGRRCDGNTVGDDTDGCYGPLIALVKQYCKTK